MMSEKAAEVTATTTNGGDDAGQQQVLVEQQQQQNGADQQVLAPREADGAIIEGPQEEEAPVMVRMRNNAPAAATNGQAATLNGHAAVQRGLDLLAEVETSQNVEEIKKLDSQLDHFNQYLDKFEKKNTELTEKLTTLLKSQKEERVKRRQSFMQREEELKAEQDTFDSQLRNMFAKCAQMRRTSAPVTNAGNDTGGRRIREGPPAAQTSPIRELNGHDDEGEKKEPAAAANTNGQQ